MAAKKKSDRKLSPLEALNVWDSRGVYPQSAWVDILGVSRKLVSEIQNGKEYANVLPGDLSEADFAHYLEDHKRMRAFACCLGQLKKKMPDKIKEMVRESIQGRLFGVADDLLYLPAISTIQPTPEPNQGVQSAVVATLKQKASVINAAPGQVPPPPPVNQ